MFVRDHISEGAREITGKRTTQAAERGWKVPDEIRADALCRIAELLESPGLTPRSVVRIVWVQSVWLLAFFMLPEVISLARLCGSELLGGH